MTAVEDVTLKEIDQEIRQAWSVYRQELRDLHGAEYEAAEGERWTELQDELKRLEQRRATMVGAPA